MESNCNKCGRYYDGYCIEDACPFEEKEHQDPCDGCCWINKEEEEDD